MYEKVHFSVNGTKKTSTEVLVGWVCDYFGAISASV